MLLQPDALSEVRELSSGYPVDMILLPKVKIMLSRELCVPYGYSGAY